MTGSRRSSPLATTLLVCLFAAPLWAQNGTVYGTVSDDQARPAAGVTIVLDNLGIGFRQKTAAAGDGSFRFREVPPAPGYQVSVVVKERVVAARSLNLNVDEKKEVWPPLIILRQVERLTEPLDPSSGITTAKIYGSVYTAAGKRAAGSQVRLESSGKSFSNTQTTGEDGSYQFADLPPADDYRLTILQSEGSSEMRYPIELLAGDDRSMPVIILRPDKPVTVEAVSTAIGGVISAEQLRGLPLYNRNFLVLGLLIPQTHDVEQGSELAGASFSIAGARPASNNFLLDGTDNVASSSNQAVPFQVNDSIQEFRVIASNAPAEFGRNSGGVVNVATRRGTNRLHGSSYGYFAHDALKADGPLSVYNGTTFDRAATYAGQPVATTLGSGPPPGAASTYFPATYNDYVNIARNNRYCTDSITGPLLDPATCVAAGRGANTFFDPAAVLAGRDSRKAPFDSKQFGASVGGPWRGDKAFFFASYEGTRINNPNPIFERVPSAFDEAYNPLGSPTDFISGVGTGSRSMFSPASPDYVFAQKVLALYPDPNVVAVPGVLEFYQGEAPNYTHVHNVLLRGDWSKSERTTIAVRYVNQVLLQLHNASLPESSRYPGNGALRHAFNQNLTGVIKRTIGASMINETRVGLNRFNIRETAQDRDFDARVLGVGGSNLASAALPTILLNGLDPRYSGAYIGVNGAFGSWAEVLNGALISPQGNPSPMAPTLDGFFPFARLGPTLDTPSSRIDSTFGVANTLSFGQGAHDMKLGASVHWLGNELTNGAYQRGLIYSANIGGFAHDSQTCNEVCTLRNFSPSPTAPPNAFLRPSFDFARFDDSPFQGNFRSWTLAGFFQDSWRFNSTVSLNLGIRYEFVSTPKERAGRSWNFDRDAKGLVPARGLPQTIDPYGNLCGGIDPVDGMFPGGGLHLPTIPKWVDCDPLGDTATARPQRWNFAPRFGVAWDFSGNGKTILRAAAGLFWDQPPASSFSQLIFNRPVTQNNAVYGQIIDSSVCPRGTFLFAGTGCGLGNSMVNPGRRNLSDLAGTSPNTVFTEARFPFAIYAKDVEHSGTPLTVQTHLTVQRQLSNKFAIEGGYVGALGRRIPVIFNQRVRQEISYSGGSPPIDSFPVFTMTNQGVSDYHSLMVRLRGAQWKGVQVNSTYVMARSLDNVPGGVFYPEPITPNAISAQKIVSSLNPGSACFLGGLFVFACLASFPDIDLGSGTALTTTGAGQVRVTPYSFPQDSFNFLADDRGRSDFNVAHRVVVDYTWDLPSLRRGKRFSAWLDRWTLGGILVAQSGQPFTIFYAPPSTIQLTQRVNLVGGGPSFNMSDPRAAITVSGSNGVSLPLLGCSFTPATGPVQPPPQYLLNPNTACTGNSKRNAFTGPAYVNLDMALQKAIPLADDGRLVTFRAEVYNVLNRANYYNPISKYSVDGVNPNPEFGKIKSAHEPLRAQFAVRFSW